MKFAFIFLIFINFSAFSQTSNSNTSTVSDPYDNFEIIIDSIKKFKALSDQKKIIEPEYSLKREKLKKEYTETVKLMQLKYAEIMKAIDELPEDLQQEVRYHERKNLAFLPNGELPDDVKMQLGYLKSISEYYYQSKSINKTLELIVIENKKGILSSYYVSANGVNDFGYQLMNENKNIEASKVFYLNVKLNPEDSNAYDSLGECLFKINKKQEGLEAYKTSFKLDPSNKNAEKIINENK